MSASTHKIDAASLFRVDGLVAFITGGGTGIGFMLAKALVDNGAAKVYIGGRRFEVLQRAASQLGPSAHPIQCDVTSRSSLQAAFREIKDDVGYLNLLACNAGISGYVSRQITRETSLEEWVNSNLEQSEADYTNLFHVNTTSVWYTTMVFLPLLDAGNRKGNLSWYSQVLITTSLAAYNKQTATGWAYSQSKAAATMAMKHLSVALPNWNIRANCIAPGYFPTEMTESMLSHPEIRAVDLIPVGRFGNESDMGGTILYLASRAGAYLNGNVVLLDGGHLNLFPSTR